MTQYVLTANVGEVVNRNTNTSIFKALILGVTPLPSLHPLDLIILDIIIHIIHCYNSGYFILPFDVENYSSREWWGVANR